MRTCVSLGDWLNVKMEKCFGEVTLLNEFIAMSFAHSEMYIACHYMLGAVPNFIQLCFSYFKKKCSW